MSQLDSTPIRTNDPQLRTLIEDLTSFWNSGSFPFQIISTPPTDTPADVQIRLFDSGGGVIKIYAYSPTSSTWYSVLLS